MTVVTCHILSGVRRGRGDMSHIVRCKERVVVSCHMLSWCKERSVVKCDMLSWCKERSVVTCH